MPFTPLHYPVAYALRRLVKNLSMPGLVVGSFVPDIEVPILWALGNGVYDHWILHSLIGALTVGLPIALAISHFVYPPTIARLFGIERVKLNEACAISKTLGISCLAGLLGHILLDVTMHPYNQLLWPWVDPTALPGILVLLFAYGGNMQLGFFIANWLVSLVMLSSLLVIAIMNRSMLWNNLLLGHD
jgi:Domain of unknown function (DUF4184)